jgi:hypothetical protein
MAVPYRAMPKRISGLNEDLKKARSSEAAAQTKVGFSVFLIVLMRGQVLLF